MRKFLTASIVALVTAGTVLLAGAPSVSTAGEGAWPYRVAKA
jgi:hypothetical protein